VQVVHRHARFNFPEAHELVICQHANTIRGRSTHAAQPLPPLNDIQQQQSLMISSNCNQHPGLDSMATSPPSSVYTTWNLRAWSAARLNDLMTLPYQIPSGWLASLCTVTIVNTTGERTWPDELRTYVGTHEQPFARQDPLHWAR
jgi:hypothetical protein